MNARDSISKELLELAVLALGGSQRVRDVVQKAYDIGRVDGRLAQIEETSRVMNPVVPAPRLRRVK